MVFLMVPVPQSLWAPFWSRAEGSHNLSHRSTTYDAHVLKPRAWDSAIGSSSFLYIFVGILITLLIAAPILSYILKRPKKRFEDYEKRLKQAAENDRRASQERVRAQRVQGQLAEYRRVKERDEAIILDEATKLRLSERKVQTLEIAKRELEDRQRGLKDGIANLNDEYGRVQQEANEAREQCLGLEDQIHEMRINLGVMQRKFEFVNQEYLGLLHASPRSTPGLLEQEELTT